MIGPLVNGAALIAGSAAGALLGPKLSLNLRVKMPMVFGCASMGLGVAMIVKVKFLAPVVLALVVGSVLGELIQLESLIQKGAGKTRKVIDKIVRPTGDLSQEEFLDKFVALLVLFCLSGTGIYGAMSEGMTGDPTLLIVKAILDLFTAPIFASTMGLSVGILVIPQLTVQALLYYLSSLILPLTTPDMLADFSACGGLIMLATGFRICGIKQFPVAGMIPALLLVMPLSALWVRLF
ncbi:DUF554 domain-containing protein [Pseudodesulfovibrio indicus]|jgi:uncharacterized membrane protein YqgA involved in biofilm formation|uniref:DUF554 domain-containing protein n=1 Tax=Pseudodesulfovibrio indicus TaxID=1716143 RepID=A0A126QPH0_9BACT|nr:DUF554 domain-containing protein [Pseudodesulfovibrio indicus]AMK11709.1 hypothetical protein AWY79_11580 [Pseudodesulfovibrio indicus]TDT88240.1 hypothetical protein EDC59_10652 [Pseudodesulfovibrio indicus]